MAVTNDTPTDGAAAEAPPAEIVVELDVSELLVSMKGSSPSHPTSIASDSDPTMKQLSALTMFSDINRLSDGKDIVVLLDYDGTLSPIVEDPDQAFMSSSMRAVVRKLAKKYPTAIVTGRCREKVIEFVQLSELFYAGSHGMDITGPASGSKFMKGTEAVLFQPAQEFLHMINNVHEALSEKIKSIPGARVEHNKFCVSVHFRCVQEKEWGELAEEVRSVLKLYPKLRLTQGRMVLEIRPSIKWDKGKALEFLLESLGFTSDSNVFPVYIGDDRTDEDAFKVLRERGQGLGILVSKVPKETCASYYLKDPSEVKKFLNRFVKKEGLFYMTKKLLAKPKMSMRVGPKQKKSNNP